MRRNHNYHCITMEGCIVYAKNTQTFSHEGHIMNKINLWQLSYVTCLIYVDGFKFKDIQQHLICNVSCGYYYMLLAFNLF